MYAHIMESKPKQELAHTLRTVGVVAGGISAASLSVALLTFLGHVIATRFEFQWIIIFSLVIGTILFMIGYMVIKKLQRVEKIKSEFLTVAAHNLRTPLTKIQWLITDVSDKVQDQEAKKRFNDMNDTFKKLTSMVNRFLELSEAGQTSTYFSYIFEKQHLEYVVLQSVANLRFGIEQKNIALSTRIQQNLPVVVIDKERMQLALNILIENAILYNVQNGAVDIELYTEKDKLICSIKDTGIGISKEDLPKIFTKFFRSKEATSVDTDRVGLELALAQEIVTKHQGTIHVSSEGKGLGARFWFELPIPEEKE
jgi:signal transduction histidine kinase